MLLEDIEKLAQDNKLVNFIHLQQHLLFFVC